MITLDLTNEEIVYVYKHMDAYRKLIEQDLINHIKYVKGHMDLYKDSFGKDDDFDQELHDLYENLINVEIPALIGNKVEILSRILNKLSGYYSMIIEAEPEILSNIEASYFTESKEILESIQKIKNKTREDDEF